MTENEKKEWQIKRDTPVMSVDLSNQDIFLWEIAKFNSDGTTELKETNDQVLTLFINQLGFECGAVILTEDNKIVTYDPTIWDLDISQTYELKKSSRSIRDKKIDNLLTK